MNDILQYIMIFSVIILILIIIFMLRYFKDSKKQLDIKKYELKQALDNNEKLVASNDELMKNYADAKLNLSELQNNNKKTSKSMAELSTLQQVSKEINSTLNINEVLDMVKDIVIGLLGVTYCTVFIKEDGPEKLSVKSSNIKEKDILDVLKEKIALRIFNLIEDGHGVIGNNIDPYTYPGAFERKIQSAMFVPIKNKGKILGLILAEHTIEKGIDEEAFKFIETIANQIGVGIDNAMLYDEMKKLATTDALTKIYNRLYFQENYTKEFTKAKGNYPLCIAMLDIDFFKKFNDTYGHDFGDEVLKNVAQTVKNNLGENGMVSRFGGEEFVVLLKNTTLDDGFSKMDSIRKIIEESTVEFNGQIAKVTISMGISECPHTAANQIDLLKTADEALYNAKDSGRNCVKRAISIKKNMDI